MTPGQTTNTRQGAREPKTGLGWATIAMMAEGACQADPVDLKFQTRKTTTYIKHGRQHATTVAVRYVQGWNALHRTQAKQG